MSQRAGWIRKAYPQDLSEGGVNDESTAGAAAGPGETPPAMRIQEEPHEVFVVAGSGDADRAPSLLRQFRESLVAGCAAEASVHGAAGLGEARLY